MAHFRWTACQARACLRGLAVASMALVPLVTLAQTYPSRAIRAIVPSGAGGFSDVLGRPIAASLSTLLGQPVVIENRPGADGLIGMEACARSTPDGYTICISPPAPISIAPFLHAKMPYDPERAFRPVMNMGISSTLMVANIAAPFSSLAEAIAQAKAKPGSVNWGSWGASSLPNLYRAWMESRTGAGFTDVPYKTVDQHQRAVIGGEVAIGFINMRLSQVQIKAGKLKPLGQIGLRRSPLFPEVPLFTELGYDLDFRPWVGVFAPAGTPEPIVTRLNTELGRLLQDQSFVERFMVPLSTEPMGGTPEQFEAYLKKERVTLAQLVKLAGVKPE
jgi:tripartite-type tricarboxylate transporter receptor subunit TctC